MAKDTFQAIVDRAMMRELARLASENERLRAALAQYAKFTNWETSIYGDCDVWFGSGNGWEIAKVALEGSEK